MLVRKRFNRYEIIRKLGRSMTDVYLALDPLRNILVVLKLVEQSNDHLTRIVIEAERRGAEIQKQLHQLDARVLEVYDFGERSGCFFVAMEHFEGRNIAEILESEHRLDPRRATRYAIEVLSQLDRLHSFVTDLDGRRRAVLHGDIKPSNIQIGAGGEVRLLDFGIAKMITNTHHLTHHNLGSPTYCSPERLENSQIDSQADLWAVGVSLYEMVSGSLPYQAASTRKLEILIQSRRPPRALPANCPTPLRAIILKALGARADRRYPSAAEFGADLRAFLDGRPTRAEAETPSWDAHETVRKDRVGQDEILRAVGNRARWSFVAGALILLGAGIAMGFMLVIASHYLLGVQREAQPLREPRDYSVLGASEIEADWNLYKRLARDGAFLGRSSPAAHLAQTLRRRLLSGADAVLEKYRNSSDPALANFEWSKARQSLGYALEIDPSDREARGKLALCDGFLNLIRTPKLPEADQSETSFQVAAADLPHSPDPHLGLAYFYTYVYRNAGKTMGEFAEAERRGFHSGPREQEQQADAYVFRAEYELRQAQRAAAGAWLAEEGRWLRQTFNDLDRARDIYEPIAGFSHVDAGLDQLYRDRESAERIRVNLARQTRAATPGSGFHPVPSRDSRRPVKSAAPPPASRSEPAAGRSPDTSQSPPRPQRAHSECVVRGPTKRFFAFFAFFASLREILAKAGV
jgi:serine/threonine protein kinase